jgi:hypothetical protein
LVVCGAPARDGKLLMLLCLSGVFCARWQWLRHSFESVSRGGWAARSSAECEHAVHRGGSSIISHATVSTLNSVWPIVVHVLLTQTNALVPPPIPFLFLPCRSSLSLSPIIHLGIASDGGYGGGYDDRRGGGGCKSFLSTPCGALFCTLRTSLDSGARL